MVAERFGGPAAVGSVTGPGATGTAGLNVGPAGTRPTLPPLQATILQRPSELQVAGATQVTGTIGPATADGDLPLNTGAGTVLLRPVPGAWPADVRPGATVTMTLGPGLRASDLLVATSQATASSTSAAGAPAGPRPALAQTATLARPPSAGAELALRGFLAASAEAATPLTVTRAAPGAAATTGAQASAASHASNQAATQAATAQSPLATVGNPQLLASTGSMQPRPGAAVAVAASAADIGRPLQAPQAALAVADISKGARTGAQDLQQQAALQQRSLLGEPPRPVPAGEPPLPLPATTDPTDPTTPRPDLMLAQALAHPGMVARMAAFLPRPDRLGAVALMLYLFGARNGGVRAWLGEEQLRHLTRAEAGALADVEEAMVTRPRLASDGTSWSTLLIPFLDGDRPSVMLLATMPGLVVPVDPERQGQAGQDMEEGGEEATAFSLGLELSQLGPVQLRGLSLPGRVVMDLSIAAMPDPQTRILFEEVVEKSLRGLEARASLRLHWGRSPFLTDLMPGGGGAAYDRPL